MAVDCYGYVPNGDGGWRQKTSGSAQLTAAQDQHAERKAWVGLPAAPVYLLVQNAYPCSHCHAYFKAQSMAHDIVIKVEGNAGNYSMEHLTDQKGRAIIHGSVPCVIYYRGGVATYVTITDAMTGRDSGPPPGFAAMPPLPE
jgi:hypothetical protein